MREMYISGIALCLVTNATVSNRGLEDLDRVVELFSRGTHVSSAMFGSSNFI